MLRTPATPRGSAQGLQADASAEEVTGLPGTACSGSGAAPAPARRGWMGTAALLHLPVSASPLDCFIPSPSRCLSVPSLGQGSQVGGSDSQG